MSKPLTPNYVHLLHGADYNPEQWMDTPEILQRDIQLMKEAHMNCVSVGIFSWGKLEPEEGVYTFDWLEDVIENLYQNGIYTILATPSGAKPVWMSEAYPEIRRVSPQLVRDETGGRHNHCYTSPYYRKKVQEINTRLAQRFAHHPGVILWHLSNEYGGFCYCPLCQEAFRTWLKRKYGTLEALNFQWWTTFWSHTYTAWSQIHPPLPNGETCTHGLTLDWKRFCTDQVVDFMKEEKAAVHAVNPDIPVTANFMYDFYEYNYFKFKDALDVVSWDSYPQWHNQGNQIPAMEFGLWHDVMRSLKRQPFLLMESTPSVTNWTPVSKLKKPGLHLASSMQAVAHGSNSVQYFQFRKGRGSMEKFHGAVVDHVGESNTRVFADVKALGLHLEAIDAIHSSDVKPQVAIVFDMENRWAIEGAAGPRNCGIHYAEAVRAHYQAFWERGIPVDFVDEECDISSYKLVVAPMLYLLRAGFEEKLKTFTQAGGTLVGTYHTGLVNENDLCYLGGWPGAGLRALFGIWHEDTDSLWDDEENTLVTTKGTTYRVKELCAQIHLEGAQALGTYGQDYYQGEPALTKNTYGKGTAYYLATPAEPAFYRDFYGELAESLSLKQALDCPLPQGVEACLREEGDIQYVFLQNYSGQPQQLSLPQGYQLFPQGTPVSAVSLEKYDSIMLIKKSGMTK